MTDSNPKSTDARKSARRRGLYLLLGVVLVLGMAVSGVALSNETTDPWTVSEGAAFDADNGPRVELGTNLTVDRRHPIPGDGSVDLRPEIAVEGPSGTSVRYDGTQDNGLVRVDQMTLEGETTFYHETEGNITISGTVDDFEWRDPDTQSQDADIRYRDGGATVEVAATESLLVIDADTGEVLTTAEESGGTVSFTLDSADSWQNISLLASDGPPSIDVDSAFPTGPQNSTPSTLSVNVTDPDGTDVDVEFTHNGETVGTDTVSGGNGTASVSTTETVMGSNEWSVTITDQLGQTDTANFDFRVASELRIYNESDPDSLVTTDASVEVTFFGDDQAYTRSTSDGIVSLEGLPVNEEMTVQVEADGYITRQTIIRSIYDQQAVFALPEGTETVNTRFQLEDPTGQFEQGNSRILIRKPISRNGTTTYETVVADEMGAGSFSTTLEQDQRYIIEVENVNTGETRQLGPYVASVSETVVLEVDQISFSFEEEELGYRWAANWTNDSGTPGINFAFDADNEIEDLDVTITERGGNGIVLLEETWTNEDRVQERVAIPDSVENARGTFNVEWTATIQTDEGETIEVSGSVTIGPDGEEIDVEGVGDRVLELVAILIILLVAGLFSAANVGVGGVVTSFTAGLLWFVGVLPGAVTGMMIALALLISVLWMVRTARGPQ